METAKASDTNPLPDSNKLHEALEKARELYIKKQELHCPYFNAKIALTSDGFNHLQHKPNRQPREVTVQILKLSLLKRALEIIPKIGTLQEYRDKNEKTGKKGPDGFYKTKRVQYWGFHAILDNKVKKIKVILRQVGDGKIMFWSVMPFNQKLYSQGIEEE
jgi:hypothetical protein